MSTSSDTGRVEGPEVILRVLEGKAFYANRFLKQVRSLYPNTGGEHFSKLAPILYINECTARIPEEHLADVYASVARWLVDRIKECPSPLELREMIAEAALASYGMTYATLYERAKDFLAVPPATQAVADRWLECVIYTTIRRVTRDRFIDLDPETWRKEVAHVILSESITLIAYQVTTQTSGPRTKHDFKKLLARDE